MEGERPAKGAFLVNDGQGFFLQLALHILGAGELLGYPSDHPVFGENCDTLGLWTPAMFWSGNQIPYIVIDALMNQPFFKNVIDTKPDWERPTEEEAAKLALYQTVVEPQLTTTKTKKSAHHRPPPSFNVLTALHNVLLGTDVEDPALAEMRKFKDLEFGTSDSLVRFPSATELKRSGVRLIKKSGIGVSNIRFKNRGYSATLYLPPFHIHNHNHTHTIHMMTNLVQHEKRLTETDREVTSYVRFMRDLAPTYKDFKMLQDKGIIQVREQRSSGKVIYKLHDLVSSHPSNFTPKFNDIMRGIKEYETAHRISITCRITCGIITFFLAVFAVAQTVFTVLTYYH